MCHVTGKTSPQGKTLLHPLNPHGQPRGRSAPAWKRVPGRQADGLLQEGELGMVEAEDLVHHGRLRLHRQAQHGDGLPAAGPEQDLPAGEARCRGVHSTAVPAVPSPPPTRRKDRRAEGTAPSKGLHAPRSPHACVTRVSRVAAAAIPSGARLGPTSTPPLPLCACDRRVRELGGGPGAAGREPCRVLWGGARTWARGLSFQVGKEGCA